MSVWSSSGYASSGYDSAGMQEQAFLAVFCSSLVPLFQLYNNMFHGIICGVRLLDMLGGYMLADFLPQQMNRFCSPSSLNHVTVSVLMLSLVCWYVPCHHCYYAE